MSNKKKPRSSDIIPENDEILQELSLLNEERGFTEYKSSDSDETEIKTNKVKYQSTDLEKVPVIPVRDMVIFPNTITPIFVGRSKSIKAIEAAIASDKKILIVSQKNPLNEEIDTNSIHSSGVLSNIIQSIVLPDGTMKLLIDGHARAKIKKCINGKHYIEANISISFPVNLDSVSNKFIDTIVRKILDALREYVNLGKKLHSDIVRSISQIKNPDVFSDILMSYLAIESDKKQLILETFDLQERLEKILQLLVAENDILRIEKEIQDKVRKQMDKSHKEYYLNEQIKAIRKELGDSEAENVERYERLLIEKKLPQSAAEKVKDEIKRLKHTTNLSSEAGVIKSYLDLIFDLPWNEKAKLNNNLTKAARILDKGHYGMEKAKERILESIAVQIKTGESKKAILCLYGPPGVGKTSLAKSIAEATGRSFIKISLGGVKDEAEIRGHRKTYIGAMPGKIISSMKKAKVRNPLILLDEIDKIGMDHRGDPASALLEVLDPEQNKQFNDHYLEVEYDLSDVMFIATANSLNITKPLLDRIEIIKIPSYLEKEKLEIAKNYIIPKKVKENGLTNEELKISDQAILDTIRYYTRESGVRDLERNVEKIARKTVVNQLKNNNQNQELDKSKAASLSLNTEDQLPLEKKIQTTVTSKNLQKFLGIKKYTHTLIEKNNFIGVVNGLAYTEVGGDILLIEAVKIPNGKGEIKYTGTLGDVMKESMQTAHSFVKANAQKFGINPEDLQKHDVHLHVPEGATPKDGPSAGITIISTIYSLFANKPINRTIGMTGEVTLRGAILAIGGLREKLVSGLRSGIKTVIIPKDNEKDLEEIPTYITSQLEIVAFDNAFDALKFISSR
jgi:ATP-dependent Lon protease